MCVVVQHSIIHHTRLKPKQNAEKKSKYKISIRLQMHLPVSRLLGIKRKCNKRMCACDIPKCVSMYRSAAMDQHPIPDIFTVLKPNSHLPSDNSKSNSANFSRMSSDRLAKSTSISDIFLSILCTHYIYVHKHTHTHTLTTIINFRHLRFAHQQGKIRKRKSFTHFCTTINSIIWQSFRKI